MIGIDFGDPDGEIARAIKREQDHKWAFMWQQALRYRRDGKCEWPLAECERQQEQVP